MNETPRTDMLCRTVDNVSIVGGKIYQATIETVDASFARQLERELAEALAEIERLRRFERHLKEEFLMNTQNYPKEYHYLFHKKFKAALEAAERGEG